MAGTPGASSTGLPGQGTSSDVAGGPRTPVALRQTGPGQSTTDEKFRIVDVAVETIRSKLVEHEQALIAIKQETNTLHTKTIDVTSQNGDLQNQVTNLQVNLATTNNSFHEVAKKFADDINLQFVNEQHQLHDVKERVQQEFELVKNQVQNEFNGIQNEFNGIKAAVAQVQEQAKADDRVLISEMKKELDELKVQVRNAQGGAPPTDTKFGKGSIVPLKELKPSNFDGTNERWRQWLDEVKDYAEAWHPGFKSVLEKIQKLGKEDADDFWLANLDEVAHINMRSFVSEIYTLLKNYTSGKAKCVVLNTPNSHGARAWQNLLRHHEPVLAVREATAHREVMEMMINNGKESRRDQGLIVELENRVRRYREFSGQEIENDTLRSILTAMLDPECKMMTVPEQGMSVPYETLKEAVLKHIHHNEVTKKSDKSAAMDLSNMQGPPADAEEWTGFQSPDDDHLQLQALGKGKGKGKGQTQCYNCKGYGHIALYCPFPKGGGKGFSAKGGENKGFQKGEYKGQHVKGASKGGKKGGPKGGCWNCGGNHFARDCPAGKGGLRQLESQEWPAEAWPDTTWTGAASVSAASEVIGRLSGLREVKGKGNAADRDVRSAIALGTACMSGPEASEWIRMAAGKGPRMQVEMSKEQSILRKSGCHAADSTKWNRHAPRASTPASGTGKPEGCSGPRKDSCHAAAPTDGTRRGPKVNPWTGRYHLLSVSNRGGGGADTDASHMGWHGSGRSRQDPCAARRSKEGEKEEEYRLGSIQRGTRMWLRG